MAKTIVGIKSTVKDGKKSFNVYYTEPFADYETQQPSSVQGMKVGVEWTNRVDCDFLKPGDVVNFAYDKGYQDRAVLTGITLEKPTK